MDNPFVIFFFLFNFVDDVGFFYKFPLLNILTNIGTSESSIHAHATIYIRKKN